MNVPLRKHLWTGELKIDEARPEIFSLASNGQSLVRSVALRRGGTHRTSFPIERETGRSRAGGDFSSLADASFLRAESWPMSSRGRVVRLVDLFSGCGMMSLGIWEACRAAGLIMQPAMAADLSREALEVYDRNFPGASLENRPIQEVVDRGLGDSLSKNERQLRDRTGDVDLLVGGPPCQGHSDLNNHTRRSDPKNELYERMARFAEVVRPKHLIIENVPAVLRDRGGVVARTKQWLVTLGYHVDDAVVNLDRLGVPQARRRHVMLASSIYDLRVDWVAALYERGPRSVGWAIGDLMTRSAGGALDAASRTSEVNRKRIAYLFDHDVYDLPDSRRPDCHRTKEHSYKSMYGRMYWDRPAQTITSGFTCMGQGRFVHPKKRRTITAHEAARLQFVPDFFSFEAAKTRSALAEMIGNAVPMKLTYAMALELLR